MRTEVCVVGTGPGGTTLAAALAMAGVDVVALEGGGLRGEAWATDTLRGGPRDPESGSHDPLETVREKRLGGTSIQWGGRCAPLGELDFERREWVAHSGWPFGLADLDPFYRRAHVVCDLGAYAYRFAETQSPPTPVFLVRDQSTDLDDSSIWRWSTPVRFDRILRTEERLYPNLRVLHHANVTSLERTGPDGPITALNVASHPDRRFLITADKFVLAAGGLETVRLLLASRSRNPEGIGNENDLVGRYYMTHPVAEVGRFSIPDATVTAAGDYYETLDGVWARRMLKINESGARELGLLNLVGAPWYPDPRDSGHGNALLSGYALTRFAMARARVDFKSTGMHRRYGNLPDARGHVTNLLGGGPELARYGEMWLRKRWLARRRLPSFMVSRAGMPARLRIDVEQSPDPENRMILTRETDAFGVPRLDIRFRVTDSDRENVTRSLAHISAELERLGTATFVPSMKDLHEGLRIGDGTHQMGVTRMSDSPRRGVVDRDCRVHSVQNLYLVTSGVFPTAGAVGPTLTIVALALRLADHLTRQRERSA